MINAYINERGRLRAIGEEAGDLTAAVWFDLMTPSTDEESLVERVLGVNVPTREEMAGIGISSRLYHEDSAAFMTATLLAHTDSDEPILAPVTFVLVEDRLVTVRYHEPQTFRIFPTPAAHATVGAQDGATVMVALLELEVDRLADVLERAGREINQLSRQVFQHRGLKPSKSTDFQTILEAIGHKGDLTSNVLECLVSLELLLGFFGDTIQQRKSDGGLLDRTKTLARDCHSLIEHADSLADKITFLLDATLGLINIEQNAILKIFSVAAVVFLPPTLIASIYGMNFEFMPELKWLAGYPFALLLMVLSAVLPYWYFKQRGWL